MATLIFIKKADDTGTDLDQVSKCQVSNIAIQNRQKKLSNLFTEMEANGGKVSVNFKVNEITLINCSEFFQQKIKSVLFESPKKKTFHAQELILSS